jgi:hypothetical protein
MSALTHSGTGAILAIEWTLEFGVGMQVLIVEGETEIFQPIPTVGRAPAVV